MVRDALLAALFACELCLASAGRARDAQPPDEKGELREPAPAQAATEGLAARRTALSLADEALALPLSGWEHLDGLEARDWALEEDTNAAELEGVEFELEGGTPKAWHARLAVQLKGGALDGTVLQCPVLTSLDTKPGAVTTLVVYNATGAGLGVSVGYDLGEDYVWHQSPVLNLKPGWNVVTVDQGARDFKTRASQWKATAPLGEADDCRRVSLVIHNGRRQGRLFIEYFGVAAGRPAVPLMKQPPLPGKAKKQPRRG